MSPGSGLILPSILLTLGCAAPALQAQHAHRWLPVQEDDGPHELAAAAASALLPGSGQLWQGRARWIAFAAVEAVSLGFHFDARADGRRLRTRYRDLAWESARGAPAPRIEGDFEYYERMSHWSSSGRFDADPGTPGLQPERDPSTYNGAQWALAADFHLGGDVDAEPGTPGYDQALELYSRRAYGEELVWDWSGSPGDQERFAGLIEDSDDAFRHATAAMTIVATNHVLAAIEAFVAGRTGRSSPIRVRLAAGPLRSTSAIVVAHIPLFRESP